MFIRTQDRKGLIQCKRIKIEDITIINLVLNTEGEMGGTDDYDVLGLIRQKNEHYKY